MANVVTLSLNDEAFEVWKRFPKGTRSPSIAAILVHAEELLIQKQQIELLKTEIRKSTIEKNKLALMVANLEAFGTRD